MAIRAAVRRVGGSTNYSGAQMVEAVAVGAVLFLIWLFLVAWWVVSGRE
jgi:hypothetical protein